MKVGYARVSTKNEKQKLDMQIQALEKAGCEKIFCERISGTKGRDSRPEFDRCLDMLRPGDTLYVFKLDRMSRSTKHLIELSEHFQKNEINLVSIHDSIDTSTAMGRFFFTMLAAIAELEVSLTTERINHGLLAARAKGIVGGRKPVESKKIERAMKMHRSGMYDSIQEICDTVGIGTTTFYRYLKKEEHREEERIEKIRQKEAK
jgi:DNA invertase Pin-like site-specific DNA recombinase